MNKEIINKIKMVVDILAFLLLILYMGVNVTGEENHELIGLSLISVFIFHGILNLEWFISMKNNLFRNKSNLSSIYFFIINLFVIIVFLIFVGSYVGSSYKIFSSIGIKESRAYVFASELTSLLLFILIGIQMGALKARKGMLANKKIAKIMLWIVIFGAVFLGGNAMVRRDISKKFTYYYEEKQEKKIEEDYIGNLYLDYFLMTSIYFTIGYGLCIGANKLDKSDKLKGDYDDEII